MKIRSVILPGFAITSAMLLGGCELLMPWTASPGQAAQVQMRAPSELEMSRDAFSRGNYGIAIRHLEMELAQHPASTAALNGLGASYDQLGRHDVALRYYFKALALAPESAVTLNNIGYSYILQGSRSEALRYLELALARDPEQLAAQENQRRALALEERAAADSGQMMAAISEPGAPPAPTPAEMNRVVPATATVPELRPDLQTSTLASTEPAPTVLPRSVRIEVSNGNGITGMAAQVRASLQQDGTNVIRLTNADNYAYAKSTIYYRAGFRPAADALAARVPASDVALVESDGLVDWVDLRLLIGRDLVGVVDMKQGVTLAQHDPR